MDSDLNPPLQFCGTQIEEVLSHKYLGVTLSSNLKWKDHINMISTKARKRLNLILPLKMKLDRNTLEIMYNSFVRPIMAYASSVWGGSPDIDLRQLEQIHLDGLRLVSSATARSNTYNVLLECCETNFREKIDQSTLLLLHRILNKKAPDYLLVVFNELQRNPGHNYTLRNSQKLRIPFCRLACYKNSFFPRSIEKWNNLSINIRTTDSYSGFKKILKQGNKDKNILYYYGQRWASVHHARMRMGCSMLQKDLHYNLHVADNPNCSCGAQIEDAKHFLLHCPLYNASRQELFAELHDVMLINVKNLLFGNQNYDENVNRQVFAAVHRFIVNSRRFN